MNSQNNKVNFQGKLIPENSNASDAKSNLYFGQSINLGILSEQMRRLSYKRQEEKNNLLSIINKNVISSNDTGRKSVFKGSNQSGKETHNTSRKSSIYNDKPVMGINPYSDKIDLRSKSVIKPRNKTSQRNNSYIQDSDSDEDGHRYRREKKLTSYPLDYEGIGEELEIFKEEISTQIKKLQRGQDKLSNEELINEFSEFREIFKESMQMTHERSKNEIDHLRENFKIIKDDITYKLNRETIQNRDILTSMTNEVKDMNSEMRKRITELEKKQKLQLDGLRFILENTSDNRTKQLAEKFLTDDAEEFERLKFSYVKPAGKELDRIVDDLQGRMIKHGRHVSLLEDQDMMKYLNKTKIKNQHLEDETDVIGNLQPGGKNKALTSVNKIYGKHLDENSNFEMGRINHFRKIVHTIIACKRIDKLNSVSKFNLCLESLQDFNKNYSECEEMLRIFVYESIKQTLTSTLENSANLDITLYKIDKQSQEKEIKEKYIKLEVRLKSFIEDLTAATTKEKIPHKLMAYLKLIITNESYIPFRFFSLFELSRLEITKNPKPDCLITGMKEKYCAMVLCFNIVLKVFVKFILLEHNFIPETKKKSIRNDKNVSQNLKILASIFFCDTIELFKRHCPIINQIKDLESFCINQSLIKQNEDKLVENDKTKLNKLDKVYVDATNRATNNKNLFISNIRTREKEILNLFNSKIPKKLLDKDPDNLDYLQQNLFKMSELGTYYIMSKENKFDLTQKIFIWVKKLIKLIKES
jgi:hypothetical protein